MKKTIILLTITLMFIGIFVFIKSKYFSTNKIQGLPIIMVDGITRVSTGALPPDDIDNQLAIKEMINLGSKTRVDMKDFHIIHQKGSNFTVELLKPYDQSKKVMINWLNHNGYSHINPDQFSYINLP